MKFIEQNNDKDIKIVEKNYNLAKYMRGFCLDYEIYNAYFNELEIVENNLRDNVDLQQQLREEYEKYKSENFTVVNTNESKKNGDVEAPVKPGRLVLNKNNRKALSGRFKPQEDTSMPSVMKVMKVIDEFISELQEHAAIKGVEIRYDKSSFSAALTKIFDTIDIDPISEIKQFMAEDMSFYLINTKAVNAEKQARRDFINGDKSIPWDIKQFLHYKEASDDKSIMRTVRFSTSKCRDGVKQIIELYKKGVLKI
jgi:hypothetical protein